MLTKQSTFVVFVRGSVISDLGRLCNMPSKIITSNSFPCTSASHLWNVVLGGTGVLKMVLLTRQPTTDCAPDHGIVRPERLTERPTRSFLDILLRKKRPCCVNQRRGGDAMAACCFIELGCGRCYSRVETDQAKLRLWYVLRLAGGWEA